MQAREDRVVLPFALAGGRGAKRCPEIRTVASLEPFGHDPDDRGGLAAQEERAADGTGIAAEQPLPERVAQDRGRRASRAVLAGCEFAADDGRHAEHAKEPGTDALLLHVGGPVAGHEVHARRPARKRRGIEARRTVAHRFPCRPGLRVVARDGSVLPHGGRDDREPVRLRGRAVASSSTASTTLKIATLIGDRDAQRRHGRCGENRRAAQHARGVARIARERLDEREAVHVDGSTRVSGGDGWP